MFCVNLLHGDAFVRTSLLPQIGHVGHFILVKTEHAVCLLPKALHSPQQHSKGKGGLLRTTPSPTQNQKVRPPPFPCYSILGRQLRSDRNAWQFPIPPPQPLPGDDNSLGGDHKKTKGPRKCGSLWEGGVDKGGGSARGGLRASAGQDGDWVKLINF